MKKLFALLLCLGLSSAQAQNVSNPSNVAGSGAYNSSPATCTNGQYCLFQTDANGNLKTVASGTPSGTQDVNLKQVGGASGVNVEIADILLCLTDGTAAGTQASVGSSWSIIQANLDGAVLNTRAINTGTGLIGGGNLTADRTLAVSLSTLTNSLAADVALNNTANYFDGPSVAQGTSGTWLVTGTVTVTDTSGRAAIQIKLWDGTTVIASAQMVVGAANDGMAVALSGIITSPAGNLRISAQDPSSVNGKITANWSGAGNASTITAVRIA